MRFAVSATRFDELAALLAHAHSFRDGWVPLAGDVPSGFDTAQPPEAPQLPLALSAAQPGLSEARQDLERLLALEPPVEVLDSGSSRYPTRLRALHGRPQLLFVQGEWKEPELAPLAIVGSRRAPTESLADARTVAAEAAAAGHTIVSGLAAGVDAAAHEGALDADGRTVAVMGTGLGRVYPSANRDLADRISATGALVSQFPPFSAPSKTTFPARNALIAALSDVSLVVEMSERSGTRIELNCALAQGKTVLLWHRCLGHHDWAQELAAHPQVAFARSITDVLDQLGRSERREHR